MSSSRLSAFLVAVLSMVLVDRASSPNARAPDTPPHAPATMAKLPVRFEANVGQLKEDVRFVARKGSSALFLGDRGATLAIQKKATTKRGVRDRAALAKRGERAERAVVNLTVAGGRSVTPQPSEELVTKSNYFIGNDPSKWRTGVPNYAKVTYPSVLDGVDLVFHGENGSLEYDFVVAPGTSVDSVAMNVDGAADMELAPNGDLLIHTRAGDIVQPKPLVYQRDDRGTKRTIASSYRIVDKNKVGFVVASYDKSRELVIDPLIGFATHLGGSSWEEANAIAADSAGNTYVAGSTESSDFPVPNALDPTSNQLEGSDAFVAKINPTGTDLVWATYFGGGSNDAAQAIAVNPADGDVFIAGWTWSLENDFPIVPDDAFNSQTGFGTDGFVARFSNDGQTLRYSTALNGSGEEVALALAVDIAGNAFVGGFTSSFDFTRFEPPLEIAVAAIAPQEVPLPEGFFQGFVVQLNGFGTDAVYTHLIAGDDAKVSVQGIALDGNGLAYATGTTDGVLQHMPDTARDCSAAEDSNGDVFVTRIKADGTTDYLTCLGGSGEDEGRAIAVDADRNAYVTGQTMSSDFPTTADAFRETPPAQSSSPNAFVAKLDASGTTLVYSTYLGGESFDAAYGIGVDSSRTAWVVGETSSLDFPVPTPLPGTQFHDDGEGGQEAFIARLNASGSALLFSTFYGGESYDSANAIAVRGNGIHVLGHTGLSVPVTPNALQPTNAGQQDAFILTVTVPPLLISPATVNLPANGSQQFAATGGVGFGYTFSVSQNNSGATINPTTGLYTAGSNGGVTDVVTVTDAAGTSANATVVVGTISSALVINPTNANVPPRGSRQFTASGGVPPYTFSFASNASGGTLTNSGFYTAGSRGSVIDIVRVTDKTGASRTATINVGPGISITPASPSTPPNGTITFSATGGSGAGYTWAVTQNGSTGATINATTGAYKAGPGSNTVDTVEVTDSLGNKASVQVSVGGGLAISPDSPSTAPRGTIQFSAFGGSGSFTWVLTSNPSGGTIDPGTGLYTAGTVGNVIDVVRVTDSVGNGRAVEVTVGPGLAVLPTNSTVLTGVQINFSGFGGSGTGYVWSIPSNQSGATIDQSGLYTSGENPGTDTVRLTDSFGNTAEAVVVVQARPTPPPDGQTPGGGGIGSIDGGTFDGFNIGGGGDDDCSCHAVGASNGSAGARLIAGLVLALGLVLRRRRR